MVPQVPFSSSPAAPDNWLKVEDCGYSGSLPGVNVSTCVNARKGEKKIKLCLWKNSGAEVGVGCRTALLFTHRYTTKHTDLTELMGTLAS